MEQGGLVEFVSRFLPGLKKNGNECHHACPFHADEGESFRVSDTAWHCVECAEQERFTADAAGFLQAFLGCSAEEAQHKLGNGSLPEPMSIEQAVLRRPCFFGLGQVLKRPGVKLWVHDDYKATFAARELIPERVHIGFIHGRPLDELGLPERQFCVLVPTGGIGSWERMSKLAGVLHDAGHSVRLIDTADREESWRLGLAPQTHDEILTWAIAHTVAYPFDAAQQEPEPSTRSEPAAAASPDVAPEPELPTLSPAPLPEPTRSGFPRAADAQQPVPGATSHLGDTKVAVPLLEMQPRPPTQAQHKGNGASGPALTPQQRADAYEAKARADILASMVFTCMADVQPEAVKWLWPGRIPLGELSMIVGDPGLGKSQICASLTSVVTNGGQWPVTRERSMVGSVLILSAEDNMKHTIRPRLDAAGADVQRCHVLQAIKRVAEDGTPYEAGFNLALDLAKLSVLMDHLRDVRLVIVDPVSAYLGETDSHKNAEVRGMLAPLTTLAGRHGAAIILVSHLTKSQSTNALMRVQGSIAFAALCRAVWGVAADKDNHDRRLFMPLKNNLGQDKSGLAYGIESMQLEARGDDEEPIPTSRILWEGLPVDMATDEAFGSQLGYEERGELDAAKDFLREALAEGRVRSAEMQSSAKKAGHSLTTIGRAKRALGVESERDGFGPKAIYYWKLPGLDKREEPPEYPDGR